MAIRKNIARIPGKRIGAVPPVGGRNGEIKKPLAASKMTAGRLGHSRPNASVPSSINRPPMYNRPHRPNQNHAQRPDGQYYTQNAQNGSIFGSLLTAGAGYLMREQIENTIEETLGKKLNVNEAELIQPVQAPPADDLSELPAKCSHCGAPVSAAVCEYCRCNVSE